MRYLTIFLILMMSFGARAEEEPLSFEDEIELLNMMEGARIDAAKRVVLIYIHCEMDDMCILNSFEEIAAKKSNDLENPIIQSIIREVLDEVGDAAIAQIRDNAEFCSIEQIKQVRQTMAKCFVHIVDMLDNVGNAKEGESNDAYLMCMTTRFDRLIQQGNPYAFRSMIHFFAEKDQKDLVHELRSELEELAKEWSQEETRRFNTCVNVWMK